MANKILTFDDVQSKKFLGDTVEIKSKGTLTTEELEITSRLILDIPNNISIDSMIAYVNGKEKIVVETEMMRVFQNPSDKSDSVNIHREQSIILDCFKQESFYKWHEIKEECFDEEIPAVLMEYVDFVDYIASETDLEQLEEQSGFELNEDEVDNLFTLNGANARLEMTVHLKRNKKQNAQNDRIVKLLEEEILSDSKLTIDIFSESEYYQNDMKKNVTMEIYHYLEHDKKVNGVTARGTARIVAPEAMRFLKGKVKLNPSTSVYAQFIASKMFYWNQEEVLEMDSKEEVIACLRKIKNIVRLENLFIFPVSEIEGFVDSHEDKIKEILKELRESNGAVYV